jgi:solute carrier family 40 (iron-regulated transporter), member 1
MEDLEPNEAPAAPPPKDTLSPAFFYTSHFLFTWNDRVWEFASVIFLIAAYPQTLIPSSIFGLVTTASAILFGPTVGRWFDAHERLMSVRVAILVQRITVAVGCILLWLMIWEDFGRGLKSGLFAIANVLGCFAKLAFVGKTASIERDWVRKSLGSGPMGRQL